MINLLTRSEALHALPKLDAESARLAWDDFLAACVTPGKDERDLTDAYQRMARFVVHTSTPALRLWQADVLKTLSGTNKNRFVYLCHALGLCTYDAEKLTVLESLKSQVDFSTSLEPLIKHSVVFRRVDPNFVSTFHLSHPGPWREFNQISQTGFA